VTGRFMRLLASGLMLHAAFPAGLVAQTTPASVAQPTSAQPYNAQQLDALLAPIALYPDELLTHILMAATFPLEVVAATRWLDDPAHKSLSGDALTQALASQPWDASVKSLVPFPVVLAMLNGNLDWMQQLGYAFATQQTDVFDSIQRLRHQAQANGSLQSCPQYVVRAEQQAIVIEPAQSGVVYVPNYNPTTVYGSWPYPSYPPVYLPPPPGYAFGTALATGLAFGAGVAITAGLWGWARPAWDGGWGRGYVNINVNRYNAINVNRTHLTSNRWQANYAGGRPANFARPPGGPVGMPGGPGGLPAGAVGRPQVPVPGSAVRPPTRPVTGGAAAVGGNRPSTLPGGAQGNRPELANRGNLGNRSTQLPPGGALADLNSGRQASQFGQRAAQSRSFGQTQRAAGGGNVGARAGGGGGGGHPGGGGDGGHPGGGGGGGSPRGQH